MSPENAKLIIVEDDERWLQAFIRSLTYSGHQVLGITRTKEEALQLFEQFMASGEVVDFILLDGDLSPSSFGGQDGNALAEIARKKFLEVGILSISAFPQKWSDIPKITKGNGVDPIIAFITQAP